MGLAAPSRRSRAFTFSFVAARTRRATTAESAKGQVTGSRILNPLPSSAGQPFDSAQSRPFDLAQRRPRALPLLSSRPSVRFRADDRANII